MGIVMLRGVNYRKAYDLVPHSWILECMRISRIAENVTEFIKRCMATWKTQLSSAGTVLGKVNIKRGIFQEDSYSPLFFFILCMIPLSLLLRKTGMGYEWCERQLKINHLLFMDDLKLFGKNQNQIDSLLNTVYLFSSDIGMEFAISKCGVFVMQRGKATATDGIELPHGQVMKDIEENGYKYLGIFGNGQS